MFLRRIALISLAVLPGFALAACEQDERPRAEPVKAATQTPAAPIAQGPAGMCADDDKGQSACGESACAGQACGCEHERAGHDEGSRPSGPIVPITEAKVGDRTRCPVSHGIFTVRENSPTLEVDGKTYHFCCAGCINRFKQNPQRFIES